MVSVPAHDVVFHVSGPVLTHGLWCVKQNECNDEYVIADTFNDRRVHRGWSLEQSINKRIGRLVYLFLAGSVPQAREQFYI